MAATSFVDLNGDQEVDAFFMQWEWYIGNHIDNPTVAFYEHRGGRVPASDLGTPSALETTMTTWLASISRIGYVHGVDLYVHVSRARWRSHSRLRGGVSHATAPATASST